MQKEAKVAMEAYDKLIKSSDYKKDTEYEMPEEICEYKKAKINCPKYYPWRTFDGTCNNVKKPLLGSINQPYQRLVESAYDDGYKYAYNYFRGNTLFMLGKSVNFF